MTTTMNEAAMMTAATNVVARDWSRTEHDDFTLRVQGRLDRQTWATPLYGEVDGALVVVAWSLKPAYE